MALSSLCILDPVKQKKTKKKELLKKSFYNNFHQNVSSILWNFFEIRNILTISISKFSKVLQFYRVKMKQLLLLILCFC